MGFFSGECTKKPQIDLSAVKKRHNKTAGHDYPAVGYILVKKLR